VKPVKDLANLRDVQLTTVYN